MSPNSAVEPVAAVVAALDQKLGTCWVGVDGKGARQEDAHAFAARDLSHCPGPQGADVGCSYRSLDRMPAS